MHAAALLRHVPQVPTCLLPCCQTPVVHSAASRPAHLLPVLFEAASSVRLPPLAGHAALSTTSTSHGAEDSTLTAHVLGTLGGWGSAGCRTGAADCACRAELGWSAPAAMARCPARSGWRVNWAASAGDSAASGSHLTAAMSWSGCSAAACRAPPGPPAPQRCSQPCPSAGRMGHCMGLHWHDKRTQLAFRHPSASVHTAIAPEPTATVGRLSTTDTRRLACSLHCLSS